MGVPVPKRASAIYELIKVLPEAAFLVTEGGEVLAANSPAGRMLGLSPQELSGKRLRDLTTDPLEKVDRYLRSCSRTGSPTPGSLTFRILGARTLDCRCHGAVARLGADETEAAIFLRCVPKASTSDTFLALNRELETLRNEHRRIRQERERLFSILESIDDAFFAVDRDWRFTYLNHKAEERWERTREELLGKKIWEVFPNVVETEFYLRLKQAVEEDVTTEFETLSAIVDGWIFGRAYPSEDGLSVYFQDITERKRAEQAIAEIRETERRRIARDLHDGVLQDLAYTTTAMGFIQLDTEGTGLEEELQRAIDAIRSAAQGLRAAVHDLRLADELDQPFPRLVESLVERHREMARTQQIALEVKEGFLSESLGDASTELLRILQEALTNARRHSGARNVLISLRGEGSDLVAEVSDDGRGLAPETVPGIGLRSMRERAVSLGGTLEVEGETGKGTRVRLRVPRPQKG